MASIEFIQKRIDGKQAEITKFKKKLDRIMKAKESNWENNPYWYHEDDIRYTNRDIEQAEKALAGYQEQLRVQKEKDNSRNIKVILEFLEGWKQRVFEFHKESVPRYIEARKKFYEKDRIFTEWFNYGRKDATKEEYNKKWAERDMLKKKFIQTGAGSFRTLSMITSTRRCLRRILTRKPTKNTISLLREQTSL